MSDSTWTWMSGNDTINQSGVYGDDRGVASTEIYPGAREFAVGWYDSVREELWLFGGNGYDMSSSRGRLNDLWRYRVNDSTWTWVSGSLIRDQVGFYGEKGISSTNNRPGGRYSAVGWYDNVKEEFWLFGGMGYANESIGYLNDLWRYRVSDSTWTWFSGLSTRSHPGEYGLKGIPSTENYPGGRILGAGSYDSVRKELWLFGGQGYGNSSTLGRLNDLWRFRPDSSTPEPSVTTPELQPESSPERESSGSVSKVNVLAIAVAVLIVVLALL